MMEIEFNFGLIFVSKIKNNLCFIQNSFSETPNFVESS